MKDPGVEFIHTRQSKRLRHHYETDVLFFTEYRGQNYTSLLRKGRNPWTYFKSKGPTACRRKKSKTAGSRK